MPLFPRHNKKPLGIYVHVPFCRSKCHYCDFYSVTDADHRCMRNYLDAVCTHIREAGILAPEYYVDTVYFGGGTPSFLGAEGLAQIMNTIRKSFKVSSSAEITFEANPESVNLRLLRRLRSEGFNRVSLGIQCDDDKILQEIGRPHTYFEAQDAVKMIRRAGFRNLSVDLMYGLPNQSLNAWENTLRNVLNLQPEHISCYGLRLEEGTPMWQVKDQLPLADDDVQADMYLSAVKILRAYGYRQYEISNFCKKGLLSRHNMKYWTGDAYLGFGPNASSDFAGRRFTIVRDLQEYVKNIQNGGQVLSDVQEIPNFERAGEYLMMRLRITAGLDPKEYESRFLMPFRPLEKALRHYREQHLAVKTYDGRWHLTPEGFLLSNTIISELLLIQDENQPQRR